ncbi:MAG: GNAT family N-acetyltransferase [Acidimicrobiales bacterium]|nr:GNAT family N-acetyltransferase [Acidimicrobiales bacterium]
MDSVEVVILLGVILVTLAVSAVALVRTSRDERAVIAEIDAARESGDFGSLVARTGIPWPQVGETLMAERIDLISVDPARIDAFLSVHDEDFVIEHGWTDQFQADLVAGTEYFAKRAVCLPGTWLLRIRADGATPRVDNAGFITVSEQRESNETRPTLGMQLRSPYRGVGYMSEALPLVLQRIAADGCAPVQMTTAAANEAVVALAQRCGFGEVERVAHRLPNGAVVPSIVYEWPAPDEQGATNPAER